MEKVKLPRKVAEAIESLKTDWYTNSTILQSLFKEVWPDPHAPYFEALIEYDNVDKLITALVVGYEIEEEPITVTIALEQQENFKRFLRKQIDLENYNYVSVIKKALDILGITIDGVNA